MLECVFTRVILGFKQIQNIIVRFGLQQPSIQCMQVDHQLQPSSTEQTTGPEPSERLLRHG